MAVSGLCKTFGGHAGMKSELNEDTTELVDKIGRRDSELGILSFVILNFLEAKFTLFRFSDPIVTCRAQKQTQVEILRSVAGSKLPHQNVPRISKNLLGGSCTGHWRSLLDFLKDTFCVYIFHTKCILISSVILRIVAGAILGIRLVCLYGICWTED